MFVFLDKNILFSTFGVDDFECMEKHIQTIAPSMVEYHLSELIESHQSDSDTHLNRSYIQKSISLDEYQIYLDYNNDTYIEVLKSDDQYETLSLW